MPMASGSLAVVVSATDPQVLAHAATHRAPPPPPEVDSLGCTYVPKFNSDNQAKTCWKCGLRDHWRRMEPELWTEFADDETKAKYCTIDEVENEKTGRQKEVYRELCVPCVSKRDQPPHARDFMETLKQIRAPRTDAQLKRIVTWKTAMAGGPPEHMNFSRVRPEEECGL